MRIKAMNIYAAYKQLEERYPENVFWNICMAISDFGVDGAILIIRDWETKTTEDKGIYLAFLDEFKGLLENQLDVEADREDSDWWDEWADMGDDDEIDISWLKPLDRMNEPTSGEPASGWDVNSLDVNTLPAFKKADRNRN